MDEHPERNIELQLKRWSLLQLIETDDSKLKLQMLRAQLELARSYLAYDAFSAAAYHFRAVANDYSASPWNGESQE